MKKLLITVIILSLFAPFTIAQNGPYPGQSVNSYCRDEKGRCKTDHKVDGDYTSEDRETCRQFKLDCKSRYS